MRHTPFSRKEHFQRLLESFGWSYVMYESNTKWANEPAGNINSHYIVDNSTGFSIMIALSERGQTVDWSELTSRALEIIKGE